MSTNSNKSTLIIPEVQLDLSESSDFFDDFVRPIRAVIRVEQDGQTCDAGYVKVTLFDIEGGERAGWSANDIFDTTIDHRQYYEALFDEQTDMIKETLAEKYNLLFGTNVLVIESAEILPSYRGQLLALQAMWHIIRYYGSGCGVVLLKPFPLQHEARKELDTKWQTQMCVSAFSQSLSDGVKKLKRYYGRLGFKPLGREFMILSHTKMARCRRDIFQQD